MTELKKISLIQLRKPTKKDLNIELQWFSQSLGLFNERDKESSCFRIFIELVKAARRNHALSSDQLALKTNLSRGTVIHHLIRLKEAGLILHEKNRYALRTNSLTELMDELRRDALRILEDLEETAERLDEELGLVNNKKKQGVISD